MNIAIIDTIIIDNEIGALIEIDGNQVWSTGVNLKDAINKAVLYTLNDKIDKCVKEYKLQK